MTIFGPNARNFKSAPDCLCEGSKQAHPPGAWCFVRGRHIRRRAPSRKEKGIMSTNNTRTKSTLQQRVSSLIAGTQKQYPSGQLTFGGVTYESTALVQLLQNLGNAIAASDTTRAKWNDALKSMRDEETKVGPVIRAYQSYLVSLLGNAPSTLAEFGLAPPKIGR